MKCSRIMIVPSKRFVPMRQLPRSASFIAFANSRRGSASRREDAEEARKFADERDTVCATLLGELSRLRAGWREDLTELQRASAADRFRG